MKTKSKRLLVIQALFLLLHFYTFAIQNEYLSTSLHHLQNKNLQYIGTSIQLEANTQVLSEALLKAKEKKYGVALDQVYDLNTKNPRLPYKLITKKKYAQNYSIDRQSLKQLQEKLQTVNIGAHPVQRNIRITTTGLSQVITPKGYDSSQSKIFSPIEQNIFTVQLIANGEPLSDVKKKELQRICECNFVEKYIDKVNEKYPYKYHIKELFIIRSEAESRVNELKQMGMKGVFIALYSLCVI